MKIALLGNPNTGKSSIFNMLTGLRQHVGNFPGITVDKRFGNISIEKKSHQIIDFPGVTSIYPKSLDEEVVGSVLLNKSHEDYPDLVLMVLDASNLTKGLLFCSQVYDLNIPLILILNMSDVANKNGVHLDEEKLQQALPGIKIVRTTARVGLGRQRVIDAISSFNFLPHQNHIIPDYTPSFENDSDQEKEAVKRHEWAQKIAAEVVIKKQKEPSKNKYLIDKVLTHSFWGYFIFAFILLLLFQSVFYLSSFPMDLIDGVFSDLSFWLQESFSSSLLINLISNGVVPGIAGVVIFIPQIGLLFFLLAILEESGYLARTVFIMDRLMRPFGLNGKSVVPLISSVACAIPGVMSARLISNWKERITTIFVAPLMSCSARLPVYFLIIELVIPEDYIFGFVSLQALVLLSMYLLGIVFALIISWFMKKTLQEKGLGHFILELPAYQRPVFKNLGITVFEKVKVFVVDAGKIIFCISIILWALASFGPGKNSILPSAINSSNKTENVELENSYIGHMGKAIEPIISPLGYDWKIGIAVITSFAAREVFVGSLGTIYAVDDVDNNQEKLFEKLKNETHPDGTKVFTLASGMSLMVFYVFAMQCMSTLAVVKRETGSWKWPILQVVIFGFIAYFSSLLTFNLFY